MKILAERSCNIRYVSPTPIMCLLSEQLYLMVISQMLCPTTSYSSTGPAGHDQPATTTGHNLLWDIFLQI